MDTAIRLDRITYDNFDAVLGVSSAPAQAHFTMPPAMGIAECYINPCMIPYAIVAKANSKVVGYCVDYNGYRAHPVSRPLHAYHFWIMRLLIDHRFQGMGYGRAALAKMLDEHDRYDASLDLAVSYAADNKIARNLYASMGFEEMGPGHTLWPEDAPTYEEVVAVRKGSS